MNPEKMLPIGVGGELEKIKETVPVYQVDNIVEYANPDIEAPFDLKEGTKTNLGLFLSPVSKESEPTYNVEKQKYHGRAGLLGRVIIQDKEGRQYRDIDAKGLGHLSDKNIFQFSGTPGILNYEAAVKEKNVSEEMLKLGLRASRVLSIIRLNEIFDREGNRISIGEAKQKEIIRKTDEPVVEIRLMGTNARIQDLTVDYDDYQKNKRKYDLLLEDAKKIISQELKIEPEKFSQNDYVIWFAENLGQQVAIMHRNGWIHTGLTDQNITLDGRIVDFATAEQYAQNLPTTEELTKKVKYSRDMERATRSLRKFYERIFGRTLPGEKIELWQIIEKFKKSYFENLGLDEESGQKLATELERDIEWGATEN